MLNPISNDYLKRDCPACCPACPAYQSCIAAIANHLIVKCIFFGQLEKEVEGAVDKWNSI